MSDFGKFVASRRQEFGYSQRELAKKAKVSSAAINKIEAGISLKIRAETIELLADALRMAPEVLFLVYLGRVPGDTQVVETTERQILAQIQAILKDVAQDAQSRRA